MKAVKTRVGVDPEPTTPDSPAAKKVFINSLGFDQNLVKRIAEKLTDAGFEVKTETSLCLGAKPLVKHATLIDREAGKVAAIIRKMGIELPIIEEPLINGYEFGIIVFLLDDAAAIRQSLASLRTEVEALEAFARQMIRTRKTDKDPAPPYLRKNIISLASVFTAQEAKAWKVIAETVDGFAMLEGMSENRQKLAAEYASLIERVNIAQRAKFHALCESKP